MFSSWVFLQEGTPLKCSMLVSHLASLWFYVVLLLLMIQPRGSALCLLYFSKSVFRKSLQEVWTGQEGTPWVASQLSTTLVHTSTHNLQHPPIELYPELLVVTKVTSAQLFTQPSSPATWSLPWATPPRVFIAGYTGPLSDNATWILPATADKDAESVKTRQSWN